MEKMATIGPRVVPFVPLAHFSKGPSTNQLEDIWTLVGPSAQHNLSNLPLWQVIAMAYFEGMAHAASLVSMQEGDK